MSKEKNIKKQECQKCLEYLNLAQRSRADYENLQKDNEKWRLAYALYANEGLIREVIPIADYFNEAMSHVPADLAAADWVTGITLIKKQIEDWLTKHGVTMYGEAGEVFDPEKHEAIAEVENPEFKSDQIVKLVKKGFMLGDKVIRAAQVIVSK